MGELNKKEALTILNCIGKLVDAELRECDAVYSSRKLLREVEDLSLHVSRVWESIYNTNIGDES